MSRLNFKDINDWTPSSISVVDQPDHPLAVFEVYEDDDEFVKKSIDITEVNLMSQENNVTDETVSMSQGFFENLIGKLVTKSAEPGNEPPAKPPANEGDSDMDKIMQKLDAMDKKIDGIDERVTKIEKGEEPADGDESGNPGDDPVPGTVTKHQKGEGEGQTEGDPTQDVVIKSREVDPDLELTVTKSEKTRMERMGRKNNGMTW